MEMKLCGTACVSPGLHCSDDLPPPPLLPPPTIASAVDSARGQPPLDLAECELDARTNCCSDSALCPASCKESMILPEIVYSEDGKGLELLTCSCEDCAAKFPDAYPVNQLSLCALLSLSLCGNVCVQPGTPCLSAAIVATPQAECALDARTKCCSDSALCPASCTSTVLKTTRVFTTTGFAESIATCSCSGQARVLAC